MPQRSKSTTTNHVFPYLAIILATAIWGAAAPVVRLTTQFVPPFTFLLFRFIIVGIVMLPVVFFELKVEKIDRRDYKNLVLLGLMGQSSLAFIFWGLKYTSAIDTAIISTIAPIITIAAGHYFFKEEVNRLTKLGILIATIGTLFVVLEPIISNVANGQESVDILLRVFGNILVAISTVLFAMYIIFSKVVMGSKSKTLTKTFKKFHIKPMKKVYSPLLHTSLAFYVGLATMIPFAILENLGFFGNHELIFSLAANSVTLTPVIGILYMAIISSIVAYVGFEWGLKSSEASDGAIFGYLGPLFTFPAAYLLLGEVATKSTLMGLVVIVVGVAIAEKHRPR